MLTLTNENSDEETKMKWKKVYKNAFAFRRQEDHEHKHKTDAKKRSAEAENAIFFSLFIFILFLFCFIKKAKQLRVNTRTERKARKMREKKLRMRLRAKLSSNRKYILMENLILFHCFGSAWREKNAFNEMNDTTEWRPFCQARTKRVHCLFILGRNCFRLLFLSSPMTLFGVLCDKWSVFVLMQWRKHTLKTFHFVRKQRQRKATFKFVWSAHTVRAKVTLNWIRW